MRLLPSLVTRVDCILTLTGFGLAAGSLYLFIDMALLSEAIPSINGGEYLLIYAKSKIHTHTIHRSPVVQHIDFTPISTVPVATRKIDLSDFDLLDATTKTATLRTQQGRILHVSPGAILANGGRVISIQPVDDRWIVQTTKGIIRQKMIYIFN